MKSHIGLIGLAVMGQNLALNIARKGYKVSVYNRTAQRTEEFVKNRVTNEEIEPHYDIESFVKSLERPRKIILMVKAGKPVDDTISQLLPHLEPGDLIIDGGNSHYMDTERRFKELSEKGILFLGMGVSGGEYGALHGPSLMPGGSREAYNLVEEILLEIAAKTEDGPCCTYVGERSAGHFVKMVHNGIEYAIMQAIAEVYHIMRDVLSLSSEEMSSIFEEWNRGELSSFLVEITYKILRKKDEETGKPMVDVILDKAEQKGTGKWTSQAALDLGIPTPSINLAVVERVISHFKDIRTRLSKLYNKRRSATQGSEEFLRDLRNSLFFAMFMAFSQGMWLIAEASKEFGYGVSLSEVLRIWKGGCIIRAKLIDTLRRYISNENAYLLENEEVMNLLKGKIDSLKNILKASIENEIPVPVLSSSYNYFMSLTEERLPANLIQAQRDFFGAHTFERVDREGVFHINWEEGEIG
ncbi:6-phosphogluconate dehydrogenase [Thermotoga maritima MSB8]|uniref:6-phosphogluconate dehydrogenase, decarboxylating n=1 Tax=Thermotoga maritima (strain ATCC 43589 / DSM 3109 / JCM 10099 / NBRC 100826 / MSB8) TaxID=243274 RepID=Q9WYR9_THEMA|nr:NADP-dependent phosphogluconate dehydrogenase [Thermotoga maritima]AAD35523.1 6-phosphogluconate dehydrogenase, decarboxylating [Thermotoga maritima MSB8]AGL49360.1 6-phosphogluconate dehydrogenase, decarboxylating [Thermotoga maritima MSB8]AHD17804.1 6-phosphogluconate dehydrogenase [Thermotoga maritima MSB8]AKE26367.1 6-phosphogluconate dehydrogenase [Thermotoga maritima]AKE28231.1 6-phosphogluconate dehydrogenase [Thermotoga maritima MSB8]